jgi:hypothetical protein
MRQTKNAPAEAMLGCDSNQIVSSHHVAREPTSASYRKRAIQSSAKARRSTTARGHMPIERPARNTMAWWRATSSHNRVNFSGEFVECAACGGIPTVPGARLPQSALISGVLARRCSRFRRARRIVSATVCAHGQRLPSQAAALLRVLDAGAEQILAGLCAPGPIRSIPPWNSRSRTST